MILKNCCFSS